MKKILTLTIMAVVAITITSCGGNKTQGEAPAQDTVAVSTLNADSIEQIPLTQDYKDVLMYLIDLGYYGKDDSGIDSNRKVYDIAQNKKDNSIVYLLSKGDGFSKVDKLWIEWENEQVMPKGLKEIETVVSRDGKSKFIIGRWKNYWLYSSDGVNFLDSDEPQKIIDDQLFKRTIGK